MQIFIKIMLFLVSMLFVFLCIVIFVMSMNAVAHAHSWYSAYCCSGFDCSPIPNSAVKITKNGYELRLTPSDHPSLKTPYNYTMPYNKAQTSEDSEYHACIIPSDPDTLRCLYTPNMGF